MGGRGELNDILGYSSARCREERKEAAMAASGSRSLPRQKLRFFLTSGQRRVPVPSLIPAPNGYPVKGLTLPISDKAVAILNTKGFPGPLGCFRQCISSPLVLPILDNGREDYTRNTSYISAS